MSGDIEAIGDAMTGAFAARAVEPRHGEGHSGADHDDAGGRCLNCGNFLNGPYCSSCGQSTHVHRSIGAFGHDFLHGVLHFEGKLWRTLPMLFWRPGELTRRYINGERARFFSPLALFLFAVFLTYATFSILGSGVGMGAMPGEAATNITAARERAQTEIAQAREELAQARASHAAPERIASLEQDLASLNTAAQLIGATSERSEARLNLSGLGAFGAFVENVAHKLTEDPQLLAYKIQANAYKFAWAVIPLSAPFLWLLYPFSRRFGIYDHLVFITYSISFMLLLIILLRIGLSLGLPAGIEWAILLLYPPLHIYRQLRGTYRGSRIGAILRTGLLLLFSAAVLIIFVSILLALGALH